MFGNYPFGSKLYSRLSRKALTKLIVLSSKMFERPWVVELSVQFCPTRFTIKPIALSLMEFTFSGTDDSFSVSENAFSIVSLKFV